MDEDTTIYRSTAFCLGVLCEFAGAILTPQSADILKGLCGIMQTPDIDAGTIDNVISAIARMIIGNPASLPYDSVLPFFFSHLPLKSDFEEAPTVLRALLVMVNA